MEKQQPQVKKVSTTDIVSINGKVINKNNGNYEYYILNKPRGVISTNSDELGRKTVTSLIDTKTRICTYSN